MIERNYLEELYQRQAQIKQMQADLTNEFQKYKRELFKKAKDVLQWKDDNLGQQFLKYRARGYISELRPDCVVLCLPDMDPELPVRYFNVSFDEIYSDNWKEEALEKYRQTMALHEREKELRAQRKALEQEQRERAEYERLKAKFEHTDNSSLEESERE